MMPLSDPVRGSSTSSPPGGPSSTNSHAKPVRLAAAAVCFAITTGLVLGYHPGSLSFWDAGRSHYWRTLYVPGERPAEWAKIENLVPSESRVASTDFVHPRYTHFDRSYDYSDYTRQVADYEDRVPDDTDYIVIDTQHPYSRIKHPSEVRELRTEPETWELLPDQTNGYFIVLKRREGPRGNDASVPE